MHCARRSGESLSSPPLPLSVCVWGGSARKGQAFVLAASLGAAGRCALE